MSEPDRAAPVASPEKCGHRMQVDGRWTRCAREKAACTWHPCPLCPCLLPEQAGASERLDYSWRCPSCGWRTDDTRLEQHTCYGTPAKASSPAE